MEKSKTNITIADVAKRAGVSKTTISRYLNGKFEFMSAESQQRIKGIIEELNFRPNNLARSLKSSKSHLIGVLIADISNPFSSILVKGITDYCKQCGYNVVVANTDNDSEKEREYILSMIDQRVEGLIINVSGDNNEFLRDIAENHVPIVLADRPIFPTMFDTVKTNDYQATIDAITYLAEEGFTKIGYFTEPINNIGTRMIRQQAYKEACQILQLEPQEFVIDSKDESGIQNQVQQFLTHNHGQTNAIFTANGVTMISVLGAMHRLGLTIPQDVAICGFDNWPWMELIGPGITVVSQPFYDVGVECVKRMMFRLEENSKSSPEVIELESQFIIRGSTKLKK
ncbi:LacI family DNA-binding transcriptional regulator [Pelosinus sp. UFO1]|uniref:LacI family DNA-binding transcriptional regulator n=1 Tax=Pelosinus sp. UFO1 TaxID=484770 RepID=UPI0004D1EB2B|nr:LacI family DNA-binding transcriptional regulator [Pelosinus sp. UFO1]AIF53377.1 transcriptional regulator, LacI family [Pelosinus sp. UFO1]